MDKHKIKRLVDGDYSQREIAQSLNVSQSSVRYWLKKHGLKTNAGNIKEKRSVIWGSLTDEDFKRLVSSSESVEDTLRKLGVDVCARNYKVLHKRCKKLSIEHPRARNQWHKGNILTENSISQRGTVKKRVLRECLLEYMCQLCGMSPIWQGKQLTLTLDHINGDSTDNRIENLQFVCPNCDSQQDTYCHRNRKVTQRSE